MRQKTCFKCNIQKDISDFYKHSMMADGHLGKCKECTKKDVDAREKRLSQNPEWKEKELARQRAKSARARLEGKISSKEVLKKARLAWQARNKHKRKAQSAVANALKDKQLVRQPCEVCGEIRVHAHHDDYSKPLDVKWLCVKHHAERHVELNRLNRKYN